MGTEAARSDAHSCDDSMWKPKGRIQSRRFSRTV